VISGNKIIIEIKVTFAAIRQQIAGISKIIMDFITVIE